ncbi:MAG: 4Fe-4S binding protein [Nitrososphaerota archaeon]|nr:4Fe-4S binding protein [Candidatus Bathyarchaeota archaeon]
MNRRGFIVSIIGLFASTALLTLIGVGKSKTIRPPGVVDEDKFVSSCIRCGKCVEVCPTGGIKLDYLNFYTLGTPVLEGYCAFYIQLVEPSEEKNVHFKRSRENAELCLRCIDACPTSALKRLPLKKIKISIPKNDKEKCTKCYICVAICPFDAISVDNEGWPSFDLDKCIGCKQCAILCPPRSITHEPYEG